MSNEPVMTLVVGLIGAVCAVLAAFGVTLNDHQIEALEGLGTAALLLGLYVRSKVTPAVAKPSVLTRLRSSWSTRKHDEPAVQAGRVVVQTVPADASASSAPAQPEQPA